MQKSLDPVQWLFFDPSVLLNENETEREVRRQIAAALLRRGRQVEGEQVERAWMQAITAPRPTDPLLGTLMLLAPSPAMVPALADEVVHSARNLDSLYSGLQLALHTLQARFKIGVIAPYRMPGSRARLEKFHLTFPVMAMGDELGLSQKLDAGGRPDPALFHWALRKAGCPAEKAAFASDRTDVGLAPAKNAGMVTIWLRLTNYRLRYPRLEAERPDLTLNTLGDLAQLVRP